MNKRDSFYENHSSTDVHKDVFNRYIIGNVLGTGESCTVRSAIDTHYNNEAVAMKIIDISTEYRSKEQARTVRKDTEKEIEILKLVSHQENIVKFISDYWMKPYIILTFERCSFELFDYMKNRITLDEWESSKLIYQLLNALNFVHSKNIIHRDIKAENVLLTSDMNLRLTDFGISCFFPREGTLLKEVVGTPGYFSPEMVQLSLESSVNPNNPLGYHKEIDIWATGIMLYILLVGRPPIWDEDLSTLLRKILNEDIGLLLSKNEILSDDTKKSLKCLLEKDPKKRICISDALELPICQLHKKMTWDNFCAGRNEIGDFSINAIKSTKNPYNLHLIRDIIDNSSFSLFKHWIISEGDAKSRASLYQPDTIF